MLRLAPESPIFLESHRFLWEKKFNYQNLTAHDDKPYDREAPVRRRYTQ